ncbi:hypothetical protein GCM10014719_47860 [Planomonospora parontospora subsp. antibiotica]|nr:hypothetical protein GCM10014719_47860 [Planomonospora parontospora subsp. antibiotica]GII17915.1 hypothetical protein Ppa05_46410 [Planomonospora parontospora subsp. antibiotica]
MLGGVEALYGMRIACAAQRGSADRPGPPLPRENAIPAHAKAKTHQTSRSHPPIPP